MDSDQRRKSDALDRFLARRRAVLKGGVGLAAAAAASRLPQPAEAAPSDPLHFIGWQYNPQIVAENVETFKKLYDENVEYELVPGEYHAIAETKLMGGQKIDMMYSEEDHLVRWMNADWARDIEDLPGVAEIKAKMYPVNVRDISLPNGKLGGLPYYTGFNSFVCNQKHLDAAKLEPPATWEEMLEQARKLKKDKIADYPYISAWGRQWASLSWSLFSVWYSEGAKVFTPDGELVVDEAFKKVLDLHRTIYKEELIPQDVFTHLGESVPNFATGAHTYMIVHEYDQKVFNTPSTSQIAGACRNAIMPGKTRSTFLWTALYLMGKNADPERGWNLMQYFGGKAKDGQYHVATRWALDFGLGTPHKEVIDSPEVQASFSKWKDMKVATQQLETATTRDISKVMWFPEWDWYMMGEAQDFIRGQQSDADLIGKLQSKQAELKKMYPG